MIFNPVKKLIDWLKDIWKTEDADGLLYLNDDHVYQIKDKENVSKTKLEEISEEAQEKFEDVNGIPSDKYAKQNRYAKYDHSHRKSIMRQAKDNPYVFHDLISDPGVIDCETPGEVVETMADTHPGWAKMVDTAEIAPDADVETGSESGSGSDLDAESDVGIGAEVGSETGTSNGESVFGNDTAGVASGTIDTDTGSMDISTGNSASSGNSASNSSGGGNSAGGGNGA